MDNQPFWKTKNLREMSKDEWESLCDGCGLCCMVKLENIDTKEILTTNVACKYLDLKTCRCSDYDNRHKNVPDCIALTPEKITTLGWLPKTCAYRMVDEGKDLHPWHHLISNDKEAVHKAGVSKKGMIVSETSVTNIEDYVIESLNRDLRKNYGPDE